MDGLWVVGSGFAGLGLTSPTDCNVYMYRAGSSWILFDTGSGVESDRIAGEIESVVGQDGGIDAIFLTHYHGDHIGGAAWLKERFGGRLIASETTKEAVESEDDAAIGIEQAKEAGIYPAGYTLEPFAVDLGFSDAAALWRFDDVEIRGIHTPGHCDGHYSFLLVDDAQRILFTGDVLFAGGRVSVQPIHDCRPAEFPGSLTRLLDANPVSMMSGHHGFVLSGAKAHINAALDVFARGRVPDVRSSD